MLEHVSGHRCTTGVRTPRGRRFCLETGCWSLFTVSISRYNAFYSLLNYGLQLSHRFPIQNAFYISNTKQKMYYIHLTQKS